MGGGAIPSFTPTVLGQHVYSFFLILFQGPFAVFPSYIRYVLTFFSFRLCSHQHPGF